MQQYNEDMTFSVKSLLDVAPCGSLMFKADESMAITASNERLWKLFECESEEEFMAFSGGCIFNLIALVDRKSVKSLMKKTLSLGLQDNHRYFYRIVTKGGKEIEIEDCGGRITSEDGTKYIVCQFYETGFTVGSDINDRLTGALNMQQFVSFAGDLLQEAERDGSYDQYTVIYNNIRNFKFYNMKYGRTEGDKLLQQMAERIQNAGMDILIARTSADHFLTFSKEPNIVELIRRENERFSQEYESYGISLKTGIYRIHRKNTDIMYACDMAKIACDAIHESNHLVMIYDSTLERQVKLEKYITEHFEEALREGYIKPYYQPVIRTITNSVCGTETLARWIDPNYGFISPADFIPILEKHHLITRLDLFILEQICINMNKAEKINPRLQPTSFNLSKLDFSEKDMLEAVEHIVSKYGIARNLIHIEVTESMVMDDPDRLKREIARFQKGGYQVWMDDFGSGYSSLNVLKEYPFDVIKLDMFFLRSFDEKSKEMIRASIRMAKRLGIQTLAEGVETREQYEFLKEIGCEKVQGYYFSKPLPAPEIIKLPRHFSLESPTDRYYYDQIGRVNRDTDRSLAIVEYNQKDFRFLYRNKEFIRIGTVLGLEQGDLLDYLINSPSSTLSRKLRYLQDKTKKGEEYAEMDFSVNGQYFRLRSRRICENDPLVANQVEIFNFTGREEVNKSDKLDLVFREMYSMYDIIFLIHPDGQFENLMRSSLAKEQDQEKLKRDGVLIGIDTVKEYIHPQDRKEFVEFVDAKTLRTRLRATERGFETRYFRSNLGGRGYVWKAHTVQYVPETDLVIFSTKQAPLDQENLAEKLGFCTEGQENPCFDNSLLEKLKYSETINFFWKDANRRFVGASNKFYRTMGIQDESVLIGKTDDEFHWIIDDGRSKQDDIRLIEHGTIVHEQIEKCIIQGVTHTILTSKEPIYQGDKIIGLLCGFVDMDGLMQNEWGLNTLNSRDEITGLLSAHGIIDSVYEYIEGWMNRQENFAIIRVRFLEQRRNYEEYGAVISNKIAQGIASVLRGFGQSEMIIARLYAGSYVLMKKYRDESTVEQLVRDLTERLKNVHELAGYDVTIYPEIEVHFANRAEDTRELIAVATGGTEIDLEQRKQLEDKLDYYDIQLETIVDSLSGGIAIMEVKPEGVHMAYASKGVGAISGRSPEQFLYDFEHGEDLVNVVPQDIKQLRSAFHKAVDEHTDLDVTYRIIHRDGHLVWINMQGRTIGMQNGNPLFLAIYRNMSETTGIYEVILDESQEFIFVSAKSDGEILYANHAAIAVSDMMAEGDTKKLYDMVASYCTPDKRVEEVLQAGHCRRKYEIAISHKNLMVYYVDGIWNGREATISYIFDITAKYTEERAKAARESLLYFEAINSSYDLIVTYNLTRNYYTLHTQNTFLGYDWLQFENYDELIKAMCARIPKEDEMRPEEICVAAQMKEYLSGTNYKVNEHRILDRDNQIHWVTDRVVYATDPESGDILGISLTMIIDDQVRERNERQNILRDALREAKFANRAKSRFLSNMSHDIRTPMNAIMGYAAIAKDHIAEQKRVEDCVNKILFSGKHLQDLINDVLDMSRIESGKEVLDETPMVFAEMAHEVVAIIDPMAKEKEIDMDSHWDQLIHKNVLADRTKLRRIMVNILGNAIKFTPKRGRIECSVSEMPSRRRGYGRYILQIRDNGIGMSTEFQEHIYDLFARERSSTVSQVSGSGLGMAIVKKYVDLMGGDITVDSQQGVGTEVVVSVDLKWTDAKELSVAAPTKDSAKLLRGRRALVVDDNSLNREIACVILEELGMVVDTADNGEEAIRLLTDCPDNNYDFVLMDMQMPIMDGVTATKQIRASDRAYLKTVPIIALTANAFNEDIRACLEAGMNAHIAKPFAKEKFIREMLRFVKP